MRKNKLQVPLPSQSSSLVKVPLPSQSSSLVKVPLPSQSSSLHDNKKPDESIKKINEKRRLLILERKQDVEHDNESDIESINSFGSFTKITIIVE